MTSGSETTTTSTERTITSRTVLLTTMPSSGTSPLMWMLHEAAGAGIETSYLKGPGTNDYGGPPGTLGIEAVAEKGEESGAYDAIAQKLLALAEKYKQRLYINRVHIVIGAKGGSGVLYDQTFDLSPPSSTTSSTQQSVTYYSAPSLQVTPREGVTLKVIVAKHSAGSVTLGVSISNSSSSTFSFVQHDLRLYLNGARAKPQQEGAGAYRTEFAAGTDSGRPVDFELTEFDPYSAGLVYISSDPESRGFTASDGLVSTPSN